MNSNRAPSVALGLSLSILPSVVLGAGFVEVDRLIAPDFQPGDASGISVAVEGDTAIVCGERHTGADFFQSGRCQVYHREAGIWIPTQTLEPSFPVYGGRFGRSVAIDGDVIVVGAGAGCCLEATDPGRAFVFRRSGDSWLEEAMLLPVNGVDDDFFGSAVAVHGDVIAVGASGDGNGAVYIFRHDATGWPLEDKLLAGSGGVSALGTALAFASADDLLAGSRLGVRAYHRNSHRWQEKQPVLVSVLDFGVAIATDGTRLIVGSPSEGPGGAGALYVYELQSGNWVLAQRLTALDSAGRLGGSIALEGDVIVAGASSHDPPAGANAGAAYVFRKTASEWVQSQKLSGSATVAGDSFGISVALDAGNLFVGASEADEDFVNIGEAYVFAPTGSNQPPVANAGPDGTFECAGPGGALVTLDGSGSSDPDGDPLSFAWFENGNPLGVGEVIQVLLPLGAHTIELQVTDGSGATDSDETVRTVVDTQPPVVLVFLDPATLWPPNHRLVDVTATVQLIGVCGASTVTLESLVSSEADDAPGGADGSTTADIQDALTGTDDRAFLLRAERSSQGDGRTYTATYRVVEASSGASAIGTATAFVPRNQGGGTDPIWLTATQTLAGTRLDWTEVPGNPVYNVIRGRLREIVDSGNAYALGSVACVEDGSVDVTTVGWEDAAVPMPGEAFVYFVEYVDDVGVSYGEESAHKPRTVSAGGCP